MPLPIDRERFDGDLGRNDVTCDLARMPADDIAERHAFLMTEQHRLLAGIGCAYLRKQQRIGARIRGPLSKLREIDARMPAVKIEVACRELAQLAESAAQAEPLDRCATQFLEYMRSL